MFRRLLRWSLVLTGLCALAFVAFVVDAQWGKDTYFIARQGTSQSAEVEPGTGAAALRLTLRSDTGLKVRARVLRPADTNSPLRTLIVIGGHRTGSRAVELAGVPSCCAIVALDYPYDGELKADGFFQTLRLSMRVRKAVLDTPSSIFMTLTWLEAQHWVDPNRVEVVGVSLGVPFAATAAALDRRIKRLWLVHGAADNYRWLRLNVARRGIDSVFEPVVSRILYWVLYAKSFNAGERIAAVAPRPVTIIGARQDERTPAGEAAALFEAAGEPKRLLWTDGRHVEPDRIETIQELLSLVEVQ